MFYGKIANTVQRGRDVEPIRDLGSRSLSSRTIPDMRVILQKVLKEDLPQVIKNENIMASISVNSRLFLRCHYFTIIQLSTINNKINSKKTDKVFLL